MISRILNSRITWWVAPALSALAVYGAGLRGIYPIPAEESVNLVERLRDNMAKDPIVPWARVLPENPNTKTYFSRTLVGWRAKPEMLLGLYAMAPAVVETRMTSATNHSIMDLSTTGPVKSNSYWFDQSELVFGAKALSSAKNDDAVKTAHNLENMLRSYTNSLQIYLGEFRLYFEGYRKAIPVVAAAESTATLLAIDKVLGRTWLQPEEIRPEIYGSAVGPEFDRLHREQLILQVPGTITRRAHLLAEQFINSDPYGSADMPDVDDIGSLGPLPWTRGLFMLKDGLNRLRDISDKGEKRLPRFYTEGLSDRDKLYAGALMLESPSEIRRKAVTRRLAATFRELIRSMIYTKIYRERFGVYPGGIDDLQKVGYLAPSSDPFDRTAKPDSPMGPLELSHVVPTAEDFERWFGSSYDIRIDSAEALDGGARTRWVLRLDEESNREAFDLALELKALEQRGDVEVASWTLISGDHKTSEVLWKPADYQLLQHWSYLEARDEAGQFYITPTDRETTGPEDLPPALAISREADGAIVELVTPSRFIKLSAPQIRTLPSDYSLTYLVRMLTVYVPEW